MDLSEHISGIQHIGVPTEKMDETIRFYAELGFTIAFETINAGNRVAFLTMKGITIETYESKDATMCAGAIDHIALDVDDVDAMFQMMKAKNFHLMDQEVQYLPFWSHGVRFFTIEGPNTEKIEINQIL